MTCHVMLIRGWCDSKQREGLLLDQVPGGVVQCFETVRGSVFLGLHKACAVPRNRSSQI